MSKTLKPSLIELAASVMELYGAVPRPGNCYTLHTPYGDVDMTVWKSWIYIRVPVGLRGYPCPFVETPDRVNRKWNIHHDTQEDVIEELHRKLGWLSELQA